MAFQHWLLLISMVISISLVSSRPHVTIFDVPDDDQDDVSKSIYASCDPCPAGWGVKSLCNSSHNTVCTPCPSGSWSPRRPHFRPCTPCSKCGNGLFEDVPCSSTRDTQCDSCLNVKGHFNEDYKRKCDWKHVPDTMKDQDDDQAKDDGFHEFSMLFDKKTGRQVTLKELGERLIQSGFGGQRKEEDIQIDDPKIDDDLNRSIDDSKVQSKQKQEKIEGEFKGSLDDPKIDDDLNQAIDGDRKIDQWLQKFRKFIDDDDQADADDQKEQAGKSNDRVIDVWSRTMEMRRKAQESIAKLSQQLEKPVVKSSDEVEDADDDEEDEETSADISQPARTPIVHVMRPLPQMVPAGPSSPDFEQVQDVWKEHLAKSVQDTPLEVNYRPSYHNYPIDSLMHSQRRKIFIMMGLTSFMMITAIVFILCYVRAYRRRRIAAYNRVAVVNLSPEEQEIVRQSASQLAQVEKAVKRFQFTHQGGYSTLVNADSTASLAIRENPLEAYLSGEDVPVTRHGHKEDPATDNQVHKS